MTIKELIHHRRFMTVLKIAGLLAPGLVGAGGAYFKSRDEAKIEATASYKTLVVTVNHLQDNAALQQELLLDMKAAVKRLEEGRPVTKPESKPPESPAASASAPGSFHMIRGTVGSGFGRGAGRSNEAKPVEKPVPPRPKFQKMQLPTDLDDAVKQKVWTQQAPIDLKAAL